ncbi:MAG: protein kinase, partial [Gemmatimonadales bacterium]
RRKVAVKVLRPELAAVLGAERFLNEIKVTAKLQHPHILPLHDSGAARRPGGSADEFLYYVMPYVRGESLREKLNREKQFSTEESLDITKAVAAALDYAHREGVIHRDIKPENILLQDGQPVVSDFGIALAVSAAGGTRLTETGLSLGTPHYMSPEQATGDRDLDGRTDVYALGAVLYEMLAGEPPYTGPTAQAVLAKVITDRPRPLHELRDTVPPHVDTAVLRALAKLPADRFVSGVQFADALLTPGARPVESGISPSRRLPNRSIIAAGTVAVLGALIAGVVIGRLTDRGGPTEVARFAIPLTEVAGAPRLTSSIAISPDGSHVVYVSGTVASTHLAVRSVDRLESTAIPGTEGGIAPFFSPDGAWVGFMARDTLWRVRLEGGAPLVIGAVASATLGLTWTPDDDILFTTTPGTGISQMPVYGGERQVLSTPDTARGELHHAATDVLPDGNTVLVTIWRGGTAGPQVGVTSLATGNTHVLIENGSSPRFVPPEHLVYARADGTLLAVLFDAQRLEVAGAPVPVVENVLMSAFGLAAVATSKTGHLVYVPSADPNKPLLIVDRNGGVQSLDFELPGMRGPRFSPDGHRVAVSSGTRGVWVYELATGTSSLVTFEGGAYYPAWTPDGQRVAFTSSGFGLYWTAVDGSGLAQPLVE